MSGQAAYGAALHAWRTMNPQIPPIVVVRCAEHGCGKVLGHVYSTPAGPLWVPNDPGSSSAGQPAAGGVELLDDPVTPEIPEAGVLRCRRHSSGRPTWLTRDQLRDAYDAARNTGKPTTVLAETGRRRDTPTVRPED